MRYLLYIALFCFTCSFLQVHQTAAFRGIDVTEKTIFYKLAENIVPIKIQQYGERTDIVFINLHDDELTSVDAAKGILETNGGVLMEIENNAQRNLRFRLGQYFYKVDPNRIFSKDGIKKSLEQLGRSSFRAVDEVEKLGQRIIELMPGETKCVIALHNNTPGFFSVTEYAPGNKRSIESKKVYINPKEDSDDFFLTTDSDLYEKLADKGYNTILQDNQNCTEDGSLSVYCGKRNIRYVNCETEHGKSDQYHQMMKTLIVVLDDKK